ncbi:GNAT family N-acetyltransferase [Candidatus Protochlamydia phocaeensis]|uniref:GNAT family N-acetyltransferase n=1 Tax=Candidatus Protochlamydia phocaeensis TaxID=1414722 RepID=UPI000839454A|nr:GNAT family N-acetyltransferase [Candidatus Protochlamydia phocaeensis]
MSPHIVIRKYRPEDVQALAYIYFNTIHLINSQHYTKEQVDVWAPSSSLEPAGWEKKFSRTKPFVALIGEEIVGFAEFEPNGHIDCFYCHHKWIGRGVGTALMRRIHEEAQRQHISRIFAEVSITAKPFFEKQGFTTICEQTVTKNQVALINYKMEKILANPA